MTVYEEQYCQLSQYSVSDLNCMLLQYLGFKLLETGLYGILRVILKGDFLAVFLICFYIILLCFCTCILVNITNPNISIFMIYPHCRNNRTPY